MLFRSLQYHHRNFQGYISFPVYLTVRLLRVLLLRAGFHSHSFFSWNDLLYLYSTRKHKKTAILKVFWIPHIADRPRVWNPAMSERGSFVRRCKQILILHNLMLWTSQCFHSQKVHHNHHKSTSTRGQQNKQT